MRRTNTAVASKEDLVGKPGKPHEALGFRCEVHEDVDGSSFLYNMIFNFCGQNQPKNILQQHLVFSVGFYVFCTPFLLQTRHVLMTILVWQYFGATIAIQN